MKDGTRLDGEQPPVITREVDAFTRIVAMLELFAAQHGTWPEDLQDFDTWRQSAAAEIANMEITREQRLYAWSIFFRHRNNFALLRLFREEHGRAPQDDVEFSAWFFEHQERLKEAYFKPEDYDAAAALCSEDGLRALVSSPAGRA